MNKKKIINVLKENFQKTQLSNYLATSHPSINFQQKMKFEMLKDSFQDGSHIGILNNLSKSEQEKILNFLKENSVKEEILSRIEEHFDTVNNSKINSKPKFK